jgi:hypothetical protein
MSPRSGSTPRLTDWLTVCRNVTWLWLLLVQRVVQNESLAVMEEGFGWRLIVSYCNLLWLRVIVQVVINKSNYQSKPRHAHKSWQYKAYKAMKNLPNVFWNVTLRLGVNFILRAGTTGSSETLVTPCEIIRWHNPRDHSRELTWKHKFS